MIYVGLSRVCSYWGFLAHEGYMVLRGTKQGLFLLGVSLLKSDTWSYMGLSKVCSFWGVLAQGGYVQLYMVLHGAKQGVFPLGFPC